MIDANSQTHTFGSITSFITMLGNNDAPTRLEARKKLIAMGSSAVPVLITALSNCNDHIRWEAARALGEIQDPASIKNLVQALEDQNVDVRWAAAESLIKFKQKAVTPTLMMLVQDFNSIWLREGARYVLRRLKKRGYLHSPGSQVLNALDGPVPEVEAPWAAKSALEELKVDWRKDSELELGDGQKEIDIPMGADVKCSDGLFGKVVCVILNPITEKITHIVVKENKQLQIEYLVPVEEIIESSPTSLYLFCQTSELEKMKHFKAVEFLPNDIFNIAATPSMIWPYDAPGLGVITIEHEHIPPDELAVHRGARVFATDGEVGRVDEFLVDPENGMITHLILIEGHIWDRADVTIPVAQIDRIEEDAVYLKLEKCAIEALSSIPLRRRKK
jgi:sporulation protein YlmC with PRC-barrel domain